MALPLFLLGSSEWVCLLKDRVAESGQSLRRGGGNKNPLDNSGLDGLAVGMILFLFFIFLLNA